MKLLRIIFLFILALALGVTFNSCCKGYEYELIFIHSFNLENDEISDADSIPKNKYGIHIDLINRKYISQTYNPFINQSYAFSCGGHYTNKDEINSISIETLNNFNNIYSENSDISNEFTASSDQLYSQNSDSTTIVEMLGLVNDKDDFRVGRVEINSLDFHLKSDTVFNASHQFVVTINLSNSKVLIDTTNAVIIY